MKLIFKFCRLSIISILFSNIFSIDSLIIFANDLNTYNENSKIPQSKFNFPLPELKTNIIEAINENPTFDPESKKRLTKYQFQYIDRDHTFLEDLKNHGLLYSLAWASYILTQFDTLKNHGGIQKYRKNFGKIVFDKDEPFWNWFVHPLSGSQIYLYYRADGYNRIEAFKMCFVTSLLFELTVEIFTEPASVQDLYQTPVLGSLLGLGIENLSMYLLNTGHPILKVLGHGINPMTLFPMYQGKTLLTPVINTSERGGEDNVFGGLMLQTMVQF